WVNDLALAGEALRRSPGGVTTKIHLATDGRRPPLSEILPPGPAAGNPPPVPLPAPAAAKRDAPGRPRTRAHPGRTGRAYPGPSTRRATRARGIAFTGPEKADHAGHRLRRGSRGGRPPAFDTEIYKGRNVVERCFNRLKQFRALATRFTKRAAYYRSELTIAA